MTACCGSCVSYLTDEDENGNAADFHHGKNKESGFCALRDLFYVVRKNEKPCGNYMFDKEEKRNG